MHATYKYFADTIFIRRVKQSTRTHEAMNEWHSFISTKNILDDDLYPSFVSSLLLSQRLRKKLENL